MQMHKEISWMWKENIDMDPAFQSANKLPL